MTEPTTIPIMGNDVDITVLTDPELRFLLACWRQKLTTCRHLDRPATQAMIDTLTTERDRRAEQAS